MISIRWQNIDIDAKMNQMTVDLSGIEILSPETKDSMKKLLTCTEIDYKGFNDTVIQIDPIIGTYIWLWFVHIRKACSGVLSAQSSWPALFFQVHRVFEWVTSTDYDAIKSKDVNLCLICWMLHKINSAKYDRLLRIKEGSILRWFSLGFHLIYSKMILQRGLQSTRLILNLRFLQRSHRLSRGDQHIHRRSTKT